MSDEAIKVVILALDRLGIRYFTHGPANPPAGQILTDLAQEVEAVYEEEKKRLASRP